jgi:hypothetical protein
MIPAKLLWKISLISLLALLFPDSLQAQPKNALKLNMLSVGVLTFSGFYERALSERWSLQMGFSHTPGVEFPWTKTVETTYGGIGEVKFYPEKKTMALEGLYVSGFMRYHYWHKDFYFYHGYRTRNAYGGGFTIGYQKLFLNKHLAIDVFAGPHLSRNFLQTDSEADRDNKSLVNPAGLRVGTTLGFAF